ncbi:MAG TPA: hypothetical protein VFP98_01935 [Candidatus Polarisedimenticolia bacterium]|nr:hypothetical protein [Candidatus Polarisedimenticolia bacterium]
MRFDPMHRRRITLGFLCAAAAVAASGRLDAAAADLRSHDQRAIAMSAALSEIERVLPGIRGHRFRAGVTVERMPPGDVGGFLLRKLEEEYPEERIERERLAYVHFGLLGGRDDLKSLFIAMLADQAGGFYDPKQQRLFLVQGRSFPGLVLVHEMAHALQDQVFGLDRLIERVREDDDRLRAVQAMIEGEAHALALRYVKEFSDRGTLFEGLDDPGPGGPPRTGTPPIVPPALMAELSFPYDRGRIWADAVSAAGGGALMDEMFRTPPESTEQILHPDKALSPRDSPSEIPRALLPDLSPGGVRTVKVNTWGEFGIRLILGEADGAAEAASGWDGDLYAVYAHADGALASIWITVWDTPHDAEQFEAAAAEWLSVRGAPHRLLREPHGGRSVVVIEGFAGESQSRVEAGLPASLEGKVSWR